MKAALSILGVALLLNGCATPTMNTYEAADVGQVLETYEGTVVSSRVVEVVDQPGAVGVGTVGGGAVGAGIGLQIGSGSGTDLAAILGTLIGAGIGYLAEARAKHREGIEYVVRTADGRVVTLVQNRGDGEQAIAPGTEVLIQYGSTYTRVIEKPELDAPGGDQWLDPDDAGSGAGPGQPGGAGPAQPDPSSLGGGPVAAPPGGPTPGGPLQPALPLPGQQQ